MVVLVCNPGALGDQEDEEHPRGFSLADLAKLVSSGFPERPRLERKDKVGNDGRRPRMLTSDFHMKPRVCIGTPSHTHIKKSEPPGDIGSPPLPQGPVRQYRLDRGSPMEEKYYH